MSIKTDKLLTAAIQLHQTGQSAKAENIYREILAEDPYHPQTLRLLGLLAGQGGQHHVAIDLLRQALFVLPNFSDAYIDLGNSLQAIGKNDEAVASYRQAIALDPKSWAAHNNLGNALQAQGRFEEAITACLTAAEINPDSADIFNTLGIALFQAGRHHEAIGSYQKAIELQPNFALANFNLGNVLRACNRFVEARQAYQKAIEIAPRFAEAYFNLGSLSHVEGKLDEALQCYQQSLSIRPDFVEPCCQLGDIFNMLGKFEESIEWYRKGIAIEPRNAPLHNAIGASLKSLGRFPEAIAAYQRALELDPWFARAHSNMAAVLADMLRCDEAIYHCQQALELDPNYSDAHANLATILKDQGRLDEAIACYRRGIALRPDSALLHSKLVYLLTFHSAYTAHAIYEESRVWNQRHAEPLRGLVQPHNNDRDPNRRIRVGYISPDFRNHVVGRNLRPLFQHHDPQQFELFCYSQVVSPDQLTDFFRRQSHGWRNIIEAPDDAVADMIRNDRIDILVDLTLHMAGNRLLVFARKPAPIQVTFAGYPGTTGLTAIDYRLTDPWLDPPGLFDDEYSEKSIRLPDSFWCFDPQTEEPEVNSLPALKNGHVTFGCLNNFCKVSNSALKLWAQVLRAVDNSRLLLLAPEGSHRNGLLEFMELEGVARDRISFATLRSLPEYLALYQQIDIGLDTIPYNGHSTSLDSYWMGVPVITIVGNTVVGRAGFSQLTNLQLSELIAKTPEQFLEIATSLARDLPRLTALRASLRQRMRNAPLMDAKKFALSIESAYRGMWRKWCET